MGTTKIKTLSELCVIVKRLKKDGKTVGLITGGFDVLHIGHIQMFDFAKKHIDILVVGTDSNKSLRLTKGKNRPIFTQSERARFLGELSTIDFVLKIQPSANFGTSKADFIYKTITETLKPTVIITTPLADKYWRKKKKRAGDLGIKFLPYHLKKKSSTSGIIKALQKGS